jgi:uncharacterized membrane protein
MEIYAQILSSDWLWMSNYAMALFLARAVWTAPWQRVWRNTAQFNIMIALTLWLVSLWLFPIGVRDGLKLHPIGATLLFLMFDWQIAAVLLSVILVGTLSFQSTSLIAFGNLGLVWIALPLLLSYLGLKVFYRYGKPNYFAFVLWNGYVVSALAMLGVALINGILIINTGKYSSFVMTNSYWGFLPVISSAESVLTGLAISGFAVALPNSVAHFNADIYFAKPPKK